MIDSMDKARPWLGKIIKHNGKDWRISRICANHPEKPWAWMVNVRKPADQVRLSMRAECFK